MIMNNHDYKQLLLANQYDYFTIQLLLQHLLLQHLLLTTILVIY